MKQFRYKLDRSNKKFICPHCSKRTFVKFVEVETGNYLSDHFGRCDRENTCQYFIKPEAETICYFVPFDNLKSITEKAVILKQGNKEAIIPKVAILEHLEHGVYIAEYFLKNTNNARRTPLEIKYFENDVRYFNKNNEVVIIPKAESKEEPKPKTSFHEYNLVTISGRNFEQNNFVKFLKSVFSVDEVKEAITKYLIGTSKHWKGATIFWQIDNSFNVRHGKIMLFDSETGKRKKRADGKAYIHSVRSVLKLENFNLNQCLFGLHLIKESNQQTIAVVESEKTAIMMSIFKPNYIWVATGMKGGFKHENLEPIKSYKIVAFPDKSEYKDWYKKAVELNNLGFKIVVSDFIENSNFESGTDLADVYLFEKNLNNQPTPQAEIKYTETEKIIHRIEQKKPEVRLFIETFGLVDRYGNEIRKF